MKDFLMNVGAGYGAYTTAIAIILGAISEYMLGNITLEKAIVGVLFGLSAWFQRRAVANVAVKVEETTATVQESAKDTRSVVHASATATQAVVQQEAGATQQVVQQVTDETKQAVAQAVRP